MEELISNVVGGPSGTAVPMALMRKRGTEEFCHPKTPCALSDCRIACLPDSELPLIYSWTV